MRFTEVLAALACVPFLLGPVPLYANPPCRVCLPAKRVVVPVVKKQVVVEKQLVVVEKPVFVREAVSYLATIIPTPTYNISTTVTTPPPQQAAFQIGYQQQAVSQASSYVQGQQAYGAAQQYAAPPPPAPQTYAQPQALPADRLAAALEAINARLCILEGRTAAPGPAQQSQQQPGEPGLPAAFGKCAQCHDAATAAKGGGFAFLKDGFLKKPFSERDLRGILTKTLSGEMPPKSSGMTLTQQEAAEVLQWANRQQ